MRISTLTIGMVILGMTANAQTLDRRAQESVLDETPVQNVAQPEKQQSQRPAEIKRYEASPVDPAHVLPYEGYKGISDPGKAKEAWVADHPEEYRRLVGPQTGPSDPAVRMQVSETDRNAGGSIMQNGSPQGVMTPGVDVEEVVRRNEARRLPRDYDDSATNIGSKP